MKIVLIPLVESIPEFTEKSAKAIVERLGAVEKEIKALREYKGKITVEISSKYDEALKEITERIERAKKAQKTYVW